MNRVYPLREGSGECDALEKFDGLQSLKFPASSQKIAL